MNFENRTDEPKLEISSPQEKFSTKQKALAIVSMAAALGGSVLFYNLNKYKPENQNTPNQTEQSINTTPPIETDNSITNNQTSTAENNSTKKTDKKSDYKKTTIDANTSYKYCPDLKAASCTIEYFDPGSGETVDTTPNQGPELNGRVNNITYLGFAKLLNIGVSGDQIDIIKSDFLKYSSSLETPLKEVSITVASIRQTVNDGDVELKFTLTINRESTLNAQVNYFGIGAPELKLSTTDNDNTIYDSK